MNTVKFSYLGRFNSIIFTTSSADHHHLGLVFFIVFSENFCGKQVHIPGKQIFLGTLWLSTERLSILDSFETVKTLGGEKTVVLLAGAWNNSFATIGPALVTEQEKYTMIKAIESCIVHRKECRSFSLDFWGPRWFASTIVFT